MSSLPAAASQSLSLFAPPYEHTVPCSRGVIEEMVDVDDWKGCALVWQLTGDDEQMEEYDALRHKAPGFPLLVLLPPPSEIQRVVPILPLLRVLMPRMILPHGLTDTPYRLRQILAMGPRAMPTTVVDYLIRRGVLRHRKVAREVHRIFELAGTTSSMAALSKRMYTSRRTIGRHFAKFKVPVPSHCLHFARLLHCAVALQNEDTAVFRIAARFGYPDGFTMSNQMKRMINHRPSEVRELLGWEWVLESWLKQEGVIK